ncbi:MAG TPA: hypothetical protein VJL58_10145 [Pyrinomonadaceae bacterium]|nr:hypothetical protein [Pyrinomonadaceae bacterium]
MAGKSDYLENKILDHVLRNTAYTSPSAVYMALFTAAPSDAGGGTEVSGNNYARTAITFGAAASGAITNSADVDFPTPSGSWGACTHFGIFDASTNGNLLYWGALAQTETPLSGNTVTFPAGDIDVTED